MGSDYWEPSIWPFRVLHRVQDEDGRQVWKQWGGPYHSLRQAAGYMSAHLRTPEEKRISIVFVRCPGPRIGAQSYRVVTLWQGYSAPPDEFGRGPYTDSAEDIEFEA
ncbi:hypothetical protein [Nocardia sp. NBC_01327]|uniref:hypothetical protein n=1 Tax=Nocardia sp. NBC_01327 TaxID=2903593 RepID=UPI002E14D283|nr:hypothetical protein OG326_42405 [Nocardia sp. NBC_01327]